MDNYIIRIHAQCLCEETQDSKGIPKYVEKYSPDEMICNLKENGLDVLKASYSSFGDCFFLEVNGDYKGEIDVFKLETKADEFDWTV